MIKALTNVGNSKAVIIPKKLIEKYHLERISLKETEEGILIIPEGRKISFQEKVDSLRKNKSEIYKRMKAQASNSQTVNYYKNNIIGDVDLDIED